MKKIKSIKVEYSTTPAIVGYAVLYLGFKKIFFSVACGGFTINK